jgi:hypothetical protein
MRQVSGPEWFHRRLNARALFPTLERPLWWPYRHRRRARRPIHAHRLCAGSVVLPLKKPLRIVEERAMIDNFPNGRMAIATSSG